jgi:uncharacterized protein (DUF302 family)
MDAAAAITRSRHSYADTVARLTSAISEAGNTLFAAIDQAAAAKSAGLDLRPTTLLIFGNPKGGTPLMAAHPLFALELPLKLAVWDDGDTVNVAHARMRETAQRYGIDAADPRIAAMDHALDALCASVA